MGFRKHAGKVRKKSYLHEVVADVETKFLNERVVVEIRFANEIVDFPFSIRSRPSSGLDHGGSLKKKYVVNFKLCFYLKRSE